MVYQVANTRYIMLNLKRHNGKVAHLVGAASRY